MKPKPPADLWEQLEQIEQEHSLVRPKDSFTTREFCDKKGITRNEAKIRLERMEALGQITKHKLPASSLVYFTINK